MARVIRRKFGITQPIQLRYFGGRPAFPQSAAAPLTGRTIAIGDAAFSHDPIGGRGLSFALGCAFAPGAVLQTWRVMTRPGGSQFVAAEKRRHLAFLAGEARAPLALPAGIDIAAVALTRVGTPVR
jgi:2-polyprenyl-6-methoxyphenol hydroxylase-like FAD-dependent oxidoreductase